MTKEINRQQMSVAKPAKPGLKVDWELYGEYLEASDLSEADKREFVETLWSIVVSFVDLGFGVHPVQQACENSCEQSAEIRAFITKEHGSVVTSSDTDMIHNEGCDGQSSPSQEGRVK